jgi:hypothetical protein
VSIGACAAFYCVTFVVFAWALARLFDGGPLLYALVLGLLASSGYQFFWSRTAWEFGANLFCLFSLVALSTKRSELGPLRAILLGVALGLALGAHLQVVPFAAATLAVLAFLGRSQPLPTLRTVGLTSLSAAVVNVPYLLALVRQPGGGGAHQAHTMHWNKLVTELGLPARIWTSAGIEYFFDDAFGDFLQTLSPPGRAWVSMSGWVVVILAVLAAAGLVLAIGSKAPGQRRLGSLAALCWVGYAVFYGLIDLDLVHPHYQWATAWTQVVGLSALLGYLLRMPGRWPGALLAGPLCLCILAQAYVQGAWMRYTAMRMGTHNVHISTPLEEQERVTRLMCQGDKPSIRVESFTQLFPPSIGYLAQHEPACRGKQLVWCGHRCPPGPPSALHLYYQGRWGGALVLAQ